jgi:hypothetical protein
MIRQRGENLEFCPSSRYAPSSNNTALGQKEKVCGVCVMRQKGENLEFCPSSRYAPFSNNTALGQKEKAHRVCVIRQKGENLEFCPSSRYAPSSNNTALGQKEKSARSLHDTSEGRKSGVLPLFALRAVLKQHRIGAKLRRNLCNPLYGLCKLRLD